jgi:hypothetical protein
MSFVWSPDDVISENRYYDAAKGMIVYHNVGLFVSNSGFVWKGAMHRIRPAPVWISGYNDFPITDEIVNKQRGRFRKWFCTNKQTTDPSVFAIPLGLPDPAGKSEWHPIYGDVQMMWEIAQEPRQISGLAYANFSTHTLPSLRVPLFERLKSIADGSKDIADGSKPWVTVGSSEHTREGRRAYLRQIRNHEFSFCPRGNGIDTHRLWETLYMGSIPIVQRNIALQEFEDLPICWVDDYAEVSEEWLRQELVRIRSRTDWNWEKLTIGYWRQRFQEALNTVLVRRSGVIPSVASQQ